MIVAIRLSINQNLLTNINWNANLQTRFLVDKNQCLNKLQIINCYSKCINLLLDNSFLVVNKIFDAQATFTHWYENEDFLAQYIPKLIWNLCNHFPMKLHTLNLWAIFNQVLQCFLFESQVLTFFKNQFHQFGASILG